MQWTNFKRSNRIMTPPAGMEDEIGSLPVVREQGCFYSVWRPTALELRDLNEGHSVVLSIRGVGHPPVCVYVDKKWTEYLGAEIQTQHCVPSILYRPTVERFGKGWRAWYGRNPDTGVVGFGESPDKAMAAFDRRWYEVQDAEEQKDSIESHIERQVNINGQEGKLH